MSASRSRSISILVTRASAVGHVSDTLYSQNPRAIAHAAAKPSASNHRVIHGIGIAPATNLTRSLLVTVGLSFRQVPGKRANRKSGSACPVCRLLGVWRLFGV